MLVLAVNEAAQVIDMTPALLINLRGQFGVLGFKEWKPQVVAVGGPLDWAPTEHGPPAFVLNQAAHLVQTAFKAIAGVRITSYGASTTRNPV